MHWVSKSGQPVFALPPNPLPNLTAMIVLLLLLIAAGLLVLMARAIQELLHENRVEWTSERTRPRRQILRGEDLDADVDLPAETARP